MIETIADRLVFVSAKDFGVTARYSQNEGLEIDVPGIFDRQHMAVDAADASVSSFIVTFLCRADDLRHLTFGKPRMDDRLTIEGERWRVVEPQPDGTGMVMLVLRKE
jgi:hypothetical protein